MSELLKEPEYRAWASLKSRCSNKNHPNYDRYGGRGIGFCDSWKDYATFLRDMGRRPTDEHTLDRINNDGDYAPGNCRWATRAEQARNRSTTKLTLEDVDDIRTLLSEGLSQTGIARLYGVKQPLISKIKLGTKWS
jgi:hypothetical protein